MTYPDSTPIPDSRQENNPNWREIDTSTPEGRNALNREIARRLGYIYFAMNISPPDTKYIDVSDYFPTDWANSVDAALTLVEHIDQWIRVSRIRRYGKWLWFTRIGDDLSGVSGNYAPTPALAICKAWLAMDDARAEGGVK